MLLSISIPVYNFGAFLGETLDSILSQMEPGVEVVVIDGASTDNTSAIVASRASGRSDLRYVLLDKRGGIDADIALSMEHARGEYCWLFSGDDIMRGGSLARALTFLRAGDDILLCRHTICDRNMNLLGDYPILRDDFPRRFDLADTKARHDYLAQAVNTEALFSFMSGLVVRRSTWLSVPPVLPFMGSCWGHVARLLALAQRRLCVHYVGEVWLDKRGDNDSFMDRGAVNRFRIAVDGFGGIATYFYGAESYEAVQVKRFLRNELTLPSFMFARELVAADPQQESKDDLDRMVDFLYGDESGLASILTRLGYRYIPLWAYRFARDTYRAIRPWLVRRYPLWMR